MSHRDVTNIAATLAEALSETEIDDLGRATGQSQRLRVITPFRLLVTLLRGLGDGSCESIADLCREFNYAFGTTTAYKAFYNRLARPAFAEFTREVVSRLLTLLAVRVLAPQAGGPLARFTDIVIHDGTSFAVKKSLRGVFPGRFETTEPAAVELHATLSGFSDEVVAVSVSPDTTQERAFLPDPDELKGKLLLADRGYPSREYFTRLEAAGAYYLMRLSRGFMPYVLAVHRRDRVTQLPTPMRLHEFLTSGMTGLDLDIEMRKGKRIAYRCRLLVLPGRDKAGTRLCTNLPREDFPLPLVARLYRFRWQIELLFKEWKSYASLRKFDTGNEHIVEGLIWASLAAAVLKRFLAHAAQKVHKRAVSTRKVAMCARLFLRSLLAALASPRDLRAEVVRLTDFFAHDALRSDLRRDRRRGRTSTGLAILGIAK